MKNNNFKDERVIAQQRKIASDAYQLISIFLLLSAMYKQFILKEPFSAYMTEFIAFLGGSLYVVLRNVINGNDTFCTKKDEKRIYLINSLTSSIVITVIIEIENYKRYFQTQEKNISFFIEIIIVFMIAFAISYLCSWGLSWFSKKRSAKIAKQYEDQEDK